MPSGESVEPLRFADDDEPDDIGGFSRGKRSYDDDEDEDGGCNSKSATARPSVRKAS